MISVFLGQDKQTHRKFQAWRKANANGFHMTENVAGRFTIHYTQVKRENHDGRGCMHQGTSDIEYLDDMDGCYTSTRKVCSLNFPDLIAWAGAHGFTTKNCKHCDSTRFPFPTIPVEPARLPLDIRNIAARLNELAPPHAIGKLQEIRTRLKNLNRRPGDKIFSSQTIFDDWAFHHGGRTELQFNIGYADREKNDDLRYGVAFSFELSQTLKAIDPLVPKVKYFNDFISLNAGDFGDMRMWHYDNNVRSEDRPVAPIPPALVTEHIFVFMGNRQPSKQVEYETVLADFDRLLPLYRYVESRGLSEPVSLPRTGFKFMAGASKKVKTAKATLPEKELSLDLRHNLLQESLYHRLVAKYGVENVRTEQPSGAGTLIDIVVKRNDKFWFYEIKTALTARGCLREAIGQLLEYSFWPGSQEPARLIVIGESELDKEAEEFLDRLKNRLSLPIEYEAATI